MGFANSGPKRGSGGRGCGRGELPSQGRFLCLLHLRCRRHYFFSGCPSVRIFFVYAITQVLLDGISPILVRRFTYVLKTQCNANKTNKQTYNSKTDQSKCKYKQIGFKIWFWKFPIYDQIWNVCILLRSLQECIETNYYIKDLGNNAVCERAEAYQSTACSQFLSSFFFHSCTKTAFSCTLNLLLLFLSSYFFIFG